MPYLSCLICGTHYKLDITAPCPELCPNHQNPYDD